MQPASVIHDIGYQRYTGPRLGRGYAARSLFSHGLRTVYALGRPAKAKIFPWAMVAVMLLVAVIDLVVRVLSGEMPIAYLDFCDDLTVPFLLFAAATAPELVSRDLRDNLLPLYFSRPLARSDYAWVKLAAMVSGLWLLFAGPLAVILVAGLFTVDTWHARVHELTDFLGALGLAAIYAVVFGSVALLIASWLRRRMVAAALITAYVLVMSAVGFAVGQILGGRDGKAIGQLFSPPTLVLGLKEWIYQVPDTDINDLGPVFLAVAVLLTGLAVGLLQLRYRKAGQ